MNPQQEQIDRGLQLLTKLPPAGEAPGNQAAVQALLDEIQQGLRAPVVGSFFLHLAHCPEYLAQIWAHFSPAFGRNSFEQEADAIREKALLETVTEIQKIDQGAASETDRLRAFIDTEFYVLPKLLLAATLFHEATFRGIAARRDRQQPGGSTDPALPPGLAEGTIETDPLDPHKAPEEVQQLFNSIAKQHNLPLVPRFYRSLGHWPDFLKESWRQIRPLVGAPDYENLKDFLSHQAQMGLRKLSLTQPEITTLTAEQRETVGALLTAYRYKILPELLIDTALMKAMLDGTAEAYTSRFSLSTADEPGEEKDN